MNKLKLPKFHWAKLLSIFFFLLLLGGYTYTFAVPPTTKYLTGETLDPSCSPGDINCSVDLGGGDIKINTINNSTYSDLFESPSVKDSIYLGYQAGYGATEGDYYGVIGNNFLGYQAGYEATNVVLSNFIGQQAGYQATEAMQSNFFGYSAGYLATNAHYSNFLGTNAGSGAVNAGHSNFFGPSAGIGATGAANSNFFGNLAGGSATSATGSNFFGTEAGSLATNAHSSNFLGYQAGYLAVSANNSNFFGAGAGNGAANAASSNFLGSYSGYNATDAYSSNFLGPSAGADATGAYYSNFLGLESGRQASNAHHSSFIGQNSGYSAINAFYSNFIGAGSGSGATSASDSNFFGNGSGGGATNASYSNFLGSYTGYSSVNASNSNFFGYYAGRQAVNAANSIFIGRQAGYADTVNNTASYDDISTFANTSILIGHKTSTGGRSNSIALGAYATNTATNQFMIGSATRPINETRINGSASTQCTITTGVGIACTSDERLKTNITDLPTDTLDKLTKVRTVNFNWSEGNNDTNNIGFLAQDLEGYFPEVVSTDSDGYKSVYYSNMTPIIVEAIRELDLKVKDFSSLDLDNTNSLAYLIKNYLADVSNGLEIVFFGEVRTKKLCLDDLCIDKTQLQELLNNANINNNGESVLVEEEGESDQTLATSETGTNETVPEPDTSGGVSVSDEVDEPETEENLIQEEIPVAPNDSSEILNSEEVDEINNEKGLPLE